MAISETFVPSTAIAPQTIVSGAVGLNTNGVQYYRVSDGSIVTVQLPLLMANFNNLVNPNIVTDILTPTAGKRLWIFQLFILNGGRTPKFSLKFSGGSFIYYNEFATVGISGDFPFPVPPFGYMAPAINEKLQYVNRDAAAHTATLTIHYNEF